MGLATKKRKTWSCRCGHRNEPTHRKCRGCGKARPKRHVPKHEREKRDTPYEQIAAMSARVHGTDYEACGVCGRPRGTMRHHRDHDHRTGKIRGLACYQCNNHLLRGHTAETLRACLAYLERADRGC